MRMYFRCLLLKDLLQKFTYTDSNIIGLVKLDDQ